MDIYKYTDYRNLIEDWIKIKAERGARSHLALAAQCSPSWMSRVLAGSVQLTPDQAMGIATYLHFNETETDFFFLLVELDRAATPALKKRIQKKLGILKKESRKIVASIKSDSSISEEDIFRYYSSWTFSAIHVACMIKSQTAEDLSQSLRLPLNLVTKILKDLRVMGLLDVEGVRWLANSKSVHLPSDHSIGRFIHSAWRNRTIQHLHEGSEEGLHYSAIHCLSKTDFEKIHRLLKAAILNCRDIIHDSRSETMGIFCLDWYGLD